MPRLSGLRITAIAVALLASSAAGASAQLIDSMPAPEKPFEALSRTLLAGRDSLVKVARSQVGLRYRLGAKQPGKAFDCSALVQWIAGLFGRDMPRTAAEQARVGLDIPKDTSHLLPGDLLVFGKGKRIDHIGIYVGDGKYIHAANRRKGIIESEISRAKPTYWKAARRVFLDADSTLDLEPRIITRPQG